MPECLKSYLSTIKDTSLSTLSNPKVFEIFFSRIFIIWYYFLQKIVVVLLMYTKSIGGMTSTEANAA
jgi:hypothetical protein